MYNSFADFFAGCFFDRIAVDFELGGVAGGFGQGVGFDGGLVVNDYIPVASVNQHVDEVLEELAVIIAPSHRRFASD